MLANRVLTFALLAIAGCEKPKPQFRAAAVQSLTTPINEATEPFFSAPWPDDRRLAPDGTVPTDYFPNVHGQGTFAATMLQTGNHLVHGWGTSAPVYMPFSGPIDPATLPASPTSPDPSVFILNVDPRSPERGSRAKVDFHFYAEATSFLPGNVLAVRPVPGFPLREKTLYAVVVTTNIKDTSGAAVGSQRPFWNAFVGTPQNAAEVAAATSYEPLVAELGRAHFPLDHVAGAALFTTQPIIDEMVTLRDYLLSLPVPSLDPGTLQYDSGLSRPASASDPGYHVFEATYPAPNMQHGTLPFELAGGDFQYDAAGTPIPGYTEHLRVSIVVPTSPPPAGGWPVVMYSHGTGGNYLSVVAEYEALGPTIARDGMVAFGIDQVLAEERSGLPPSARPTGCLTMPVEFCFSDFVNSVAGRNNLRQSVLDNVNLRRLIANPSTVIPASSNSSTAAGFTNPLGAPITFDSTRIAFLGHSQGGLTGALYLPLDPVPLGGVLSGSGGHLSTTILLGQGPPVRPLLEGPLFLDLPAGEFLDAFHPVVALIQTLAEAVDPINWGARWIAQPVAGSRPKHVFTTSGLLDADTPAETAEYLNVAAQVPQLQPLAHAASSYVLSGIPPIEAPVSGNLTVPGGAVTAAFQQWPAPQRHFVIFEKREARHEWATFLQTLMADGTPTIPADSATCTCADGACADAAGLCEDGTSCNLCGVCACFGNQGNTCPINGRGDCEPGSTSAN